MLLSLARRNSLFCLGVPLVVALMAHAAPAQVATPARGTSKAQVEKHFGAPTDRVAAVGDPPISSWVYPGFTVYFEYDHVIHAVLTPSK